MQFETPGTILFWTSEGPRAVEADRRTECNVAAARLVVAGRARYPDLVNAADAGPLLTSISARVADDIAGDTVLLSVHPGRRLGVGPTVLFGHAAQRAGTRGAGRAASTFHATLEQLWLPWALRPKDVPGGTFPGSAKAWLCGERGN
ncbi:hypothetical protein KB874_09345 [Aestuariicoccus sp. KMU-90]|uniref:Uncharacterized protein n=1 Tax=Thetidibacter halocola TaxID=2827239 RepID=A0A8J7WEP4_9RHOB|nr:hypothetical protein [Thetidibacter halocola]